MTIFTLHNLLIRDDYSAAVSHVFYAISCQLLPARANSKGAQHVLLSRPKQLQRTSSRLKSVNCVDIYIYEARYSDIRSIQLFLVGPHIQQL